MSLLRLRRESGRSTRAIEAASRSFPSSRLLSLPHTRSPVRALFLVTISTVEHGRAVHLLKPGTKKRKRKSELEEEKMHQHASKRKLQEYDAMAASFVKLQEEN